MYRHLLVPLDGSELATTLVSQAVDFACALGARITFFTMREDYASSGEGALVRAVSPDDFAELAAGDAHAILAKATAAAHASKLDCSAVVRTGRHPHEEILNVAREAGCDLIYMASHGRRGLKALLPGSQTQRVLAHSTLPVLVATVETNSTHEASAAAIAIIKDEHRSIAAVTRGMRQVAARLRAGEAGDLDFLESMLRYIRDFPDALHHPKEERYLFERLSRRTHEADELIADLTQEHREGEALLGAIAVAVARCREVAHPAASSAEPRALGDLIDQFVDGQWRHLATEEKLILPAAQRHLTAADWSEIEAAFRANDGFGRNGQSDETYRRFFTRLMNLIAETRGA